MNMKNIKNAEAEAKRFLARIAEYKTAVKNAKYVGHYGTEYTAATPKESGALRRSSLDLTRSLADMRKP